VARQVLEALRLAVRRRMVSDVPVGVLLVGRGGQLADRRTARRRRAESHLATYSIGFEEAHGEKGDEFKYSDLIAERIRNEAPQDIHSVIRNDGASARAIAAMSEPMVSYDNIGFFLLSREVAKSIKVVQSGQGADEVFGGYHWYPPLTNSNAPVRDYAAAFFDRTHERLAQQSISGASGGPRREPCLRRGAFCTPGADDAVDKALRLDTNVMLVDDPVKRVDNMTMAWGLEARVPFLDHELVELGGRIPARHKLAHGGKGVLKEAARKVMPADVIDRPKGYFPVPALKYLQGPYLDMVRDALTNEQARERGLFRQDYLDRLFAEPEAHITKLRGSELWQVALLEMWLQTQEV
jgi:asparagine synthase (glutamine-hydrolysing)